VDAGFVCDKAALIRDKIKGTFCRGNKWIMNAMGRRQMWGIELFTEKWKRPAVEVKCFMSP
jgi:hypothetical protein